MSDRDALPRPRPGELWIRADGVLVEVVDVLTERDSSWISVEFRRLGENLGNELAPLIHFLASFRRLASLWNPLPWRETAEGEP